MKIKLKNTLIPAVTAAIGFLVFLTQVISTPNAVWANSLLPAQSDADHGKPIEQAEGLSPLFPPAIQQWKLEIEKQAYESKIDPNLIGAIILQESGGDPLAFSSSGAVGLMQVMPRDGLAAGFICNGIPCFHSRPSIQELSDPHFNIEYGTRMLMNLHGQFGNWRDALHSYGPYDMGYRYADLVLALRDQFLQNGMKSTTG